MIFYTFLILFIVLILFGTIFIVKQQSAAVVERFGKFVSTRHSGLQIKIPIVDRVAGRLSLRIQQLDVVVETKTKDDVFVKVKVSVQYKVIRDKVYDAFYKLDYPQDQITSYVFDVVRAEVPKMILDDVFEKKDDIAIAVKGELNEAMKNYGFDIIKTLVTDIDPDAQVKESMNRINASEREKVAASVITRSMSCPGAHCFTLQSTCTPALASMRPHSLRFKRTAASSGLNLTPCVSHPSLRLASAPAFTKAARHAA